MHMAQTQNEHEQRVMPAGLEKMWEGSHEVEYCDWKVILVAPSRGSRWPHVIQQARLLPLLPQARKVDADALLLRQRRRLRNVTPL